MKRACIYVRVSTDEQAENGTSIDNQVEKSLTYAAAHGMIIVGIFREDYTGTTLDRPELNKVRAMLRAGQADALIVYKTNRLDRSEWGINLLILLQELKSLEVELHYSQSGRAVDLGNPVEALMQSIEGWQAGEDRTEVVRRLYEGRISRIEQGGVIVDGKPPYGYRLVKDGNLFKLEIDEDEARIIRLIFFWFTVGEKGIPMTISGIQKRLNEIQAPTASQTDHRLVGRKSDTPFWRRGVVHQILQNETYAGTWWYNKIKRVNGKVIRRSRDECIPVNVPAIIDRATWETAQKRLQENKRLAGAKPKYPYLMRQLMKCACGYKIKGVPDAKGGKLYYGCPGRRNRREHRPCDLPFFPADKVDNVIWEWVRGFFEDERILKQGIDDYLARQKTVTAPLLEELATIDATIKEQEDALMEKRNLYEELKNRKTERVKAGLLNDMERIEATLDGLDEARGKVQGKLDAALIARQDVQAAIDRVQQIRIDLGEALDLADVTFEDKRFLIERLNVQATLLVENGERIVDAHCYLDDRRLELSNTPKGHFRQV